MTPDANDQEASRRERSSASNSWEDQLLDETIDSSSTSVSSGDERAVGLTILAHPDSRRVGERALISGHRTSSGALLSRLEPHFCQPEGGTLRPLADRHLSRQPIRAHRFAGGLRFDLSQTRTSLEIDGQPASPGTAVSAEQLQRGAVMLLANRICLLLHQLEASSASVERPPSLVGLNEKMLVIYEEIRRVASTDLSVLLSGETGTGKELVARAIHDASDRRGSPFVAVNVASLAPTLAAAELFGVRPGAFTDARRPRRGLFRQAAGGTLLLDEIGAADLEVQAMLLRVLEDKVVRSVGADSGDEIDVRVVAASDLDLEAAVARGAFREPLLQRLASYEIYLPPLRERRDDFGRLLLHFLQSALQELGAEERLEPSSEKESWLGARLVAELAQRSFPGNVRQLDNLARRMALRFHDAPRVDSALVLRWVDSSPLDRVSQGSLDPGPLQASVESAPTARRGSRRRYRDPAEVTDEEVVAALEAHDWRIRAAARALNVSRGSLYALIDKSDRVRKAADLDRREIEQSLQETGGNIPAAARRLRVSRHGLKQRMKELDLV